MSATAPAAPTVSVIVPVYRHWNDLQRLLNHLGVQEGLNVPSVVSSVEILVVDNGDPADRPELDLPEAIPTRVLHCPQPGSYAARNAGVADAAGELLLFTDADTSPRPDWIASLVAAHLRQPGRVLAGAIAMYAGDPPNRYEVFDRIKGIPQERYVRQGYATTANLAVPREAYDAVGGFDATRYSGGDADFTRRAGAAGYPVTLIPEAVVEHPSRSTWAELSTKARRIKGGQLRSGTRKQRAKWWLRTVTPPVFASARILRSDRPARERATALGVLHQLWFVELGESARLLAGRTPERS